MISFENDSVKGLSFMGFKKKNDKDDDRRTLSGYVDGVLKTNYLRATFRTDLTWGSMCSEVGLTY